MENNQVEWIMIKKVTSKENLKTVLKIFGYAALMLIGSFCFMILIFELMVWFWQSTLIEELAKLVR
jgi:phosphotransferase system  glucose/maltose/N-acetylglucosamine-specific IIC component